MAAAGAAAGAAACIVADYNLQNQITGNQEVDEVLMRSVEEWLTAADWRVLFENRDLFMPINHSLIPVETAGLFKAASTHIQDNNDWDWDTGSHSMLITRNELGVRSFIVRFVEGLWVEAGENGQEIVLRRRVVRSFRPYERATFIHYRYEVLD